MVHEEINYEVKYRKIKYPRLEFKSGELELILPFDESPKDLLEKHRNWVIKKRSFIEECLKASNDKELESREDEEFREIVNYMTEEISENLNVNINQVFFRKMRTKWASCSPRKNLTINTMMKYLPEKLIEYIIYHELAHLIEKKHNERFWDIIEKKFNNSRELEMSLFANWFLINSKKDLLYEQ